MANRVFNPCDILLLNEHMHVQQEVTNYCKAIPICFTDTFTENFGSTEKEKGILL